MALIACSECKKEISDKAVACPHCGNPMANGSRYQPIPVLTQPGQAVTTEATGKTYKQMQLVGAAMILMGIFSCTAGEKTAAMTGILFLIGAGLAIAGKIGAWWHHG